MSSVSKKEKQYDYLIVGQGLAGSLLGYSLLQRGCNIKIIDDGHDESATKVAAGIINPITGRKFVKSWLIDELLPKAKEVYQACEHLFRQSFWYDRILYRAITSKSASNEWVIRSGRTGWGKYMKTLVEEPEELRCFAKVVGWGLTEGAVQVNISTLIQAFRSYFIEKQVLKPGKFHFSKMSLSMDNIRYDGMTADRIVFCEGAGVRQNPLFNNLPFSPVKGEVIHLEAQELPKDILVKHTLLFAPLSDGYHWCGANYDHEFTDNLPSSTGKTWLLNRLHKVLKTNFTIVQHEAGIRPATLDRRPIMGQHSAYNNVYLFNGFGTKGTSLIPYFTEHMVDFLEKKVPLSEKVSLTRF